MPEGERRPYESPRRREQARATRAAIADAARTLFVERGWARTRVRDVAAAARVAEPTVYAAYGSKAGLALALVDAVGHLADDGVQEAELATAAGDPRGQLAAMVGFDRRLYERGGDVLRLLMSAGEPDLAAAYRDGRAQADRLRRQVIGSWPKGALRAGVTADDAVDTYAALCHIGTYTVLTEERRWPPERVERWWATTLADLLLG